MAFAGSLACSSGSLVLRNARTSDPCLLSSLRPSCSPLMGQSPVGATRRTSRRMGTLHVAAKTKEKVEEKKKDKKRSEKEPKEASTATDVTPSPEVTNGKATAVADTPAEAEAPQDEEPHKEKKKDKKGKKDKEKKSKPSSFKFVKYQGLGNDFILVDSRSSSELPLTPEEAVRVCDRNFGVGGDGVIFLLPGEMGTNYSMRIINSDGSEPEMCGNGIRCLAKFAAELEEVKEAKYTISTLGGPMTPVLGSEGLVEVDMGAPILAAQDVPCTLPGRALDGAAVQVPLSVGGTTWIVTCVSMGNPHCVTFGTVDGKPIPLSEMDLREVGPLFENHPVFPRRINTEFVEVLSRSHVRMRVWERGAGQTLACGTGACAVVVAGVLEGRTERKCVVDLPGGPLVIEWRESNNHIYMTGPAERVFSGTIHL